ncbi:hypothetical protein FIBSPDRAFT_590220 [Athelia psychrophila]|uniref:Uncharacterized protein n=1 Tax=Athelia psychrophila TaxID=1759441 RepID=A0A166H8Q9_9AGAM|nr:hypothetical protein FIBSPDRAFT_590220 [Fibularhizoctonia sp. CBS 109695]
MFNCYRFRIQTSKAGRRTILERTRLGERGRHKDPSEKVRRKCERATSGDLDSNEVVDVDNALLIAGTVDVVDLRAFAQDVAGATGEYEAWQSQKIITLNAVANGSGVGGQAPVNGPPVRGIGCQCSFGRIDMP